MRCAAITRAGVRCKLEATSGSYCWSHAPENAQERKRRAQRGGKAKGGIGGELEEIKREIKGVIRDVLAGEVERGAGAVALQGYNTLLRAVEVGRRDDLEDLAREVEELKRGYGGAA